MSSLYKSHVNTSSETIPANVHPENTNANVHPEDSNI